jgi:glycosyltransferase involved in cell wall biosynthesis
MSKLLTVFTPTYNRAYTLHLCYESLIRQTSRDFEWLIIDDGSTDETRELVAGWIKDNRIPIRYHYQENQGMHGAHNAAYERITTELNVCIDSDDYMTDDAVAKICAFWREHGGAQYAGLAGLDITRSGEVIGTRLPKGLKQAALTDLYVLHQVRGDKKLVYRTAVTAGVPPYPVYPGEKYVPLSYKYMLIDQQFPLLLMDEPLCVVEYLQDGSSLNMIKQYRANPRGFQFFRKVAIMAAAIARGRPLCVEQLVAAQSALSAGIAAQRRDAAGVACRRGALSLYSEYGQNGCAGAQALALPRSVRHRKGIRL